MYHSWSEIYYFPKEVNLEFFFSMTVNWLTCTGANDVFFQSNLKLLVIDLKY